MLAPVSLSLLGGFRAEQNGEPIAAFESNKVRALLAHQCAEALNQPEQLAAIAELVGDVYAVRGPLQLAYN